MSGEVQRVAVLGAGTMGHGIAQVAAQSGFDVTLFDVDRTVLELGLERIRGNLAKGVEKGKVSAADRDEALARIRGALDLGDAAAAADLVIEATPERMDLKAKLFAELSRVTAPDAVLATNTSSLPVSDIAAAATEPARVLGMHFFNPPYVLTLLEIVRARQTSEATLDTAKRVAERMGRDVIVVKDSPGFATSRLGVALGLEAMRMLEDGVASAEDIDRAMKLGYRHPMGPLELTDHVGLDVRLAIAEHLHREVGEQFRPPEILRRLVCEGKLGKKTGVGFHRWDR
ncbi:MAG: 3-hydroxyacyl-CoA dehydrogenase family protein [Candidatus Eiseniibacteriota bacterium]